MSKSIEQRIVEMKFDNRQFESGVKTSMSTIDKLKESLNFKGATKGLENIGSAAKNTNMAGLGSAVENVKVKFSALQVVAVTALTNMTNSAINAGKKMISALTVDPIKSGFQEYETQINAIQTILANTSAKGTTLNQVNAALNELNKYADMTIYNFTEMTRNIGTFTAAGVDLDTSVSAIKGIANLAAVSGSTSQQASTAMYQLSQALASGTVKLQDWNSVVNAGMGGEVFQNALKETARAHGTAIDDMITSEGSFRETLKDGWITSQVLTETLDKFTGDLNEKQLKAQGYTQEQIVEIMKLGDMANKAATEVKTFSQLWDTLQEAAQSGWTQSWEIIIGDFNEAKTLLTEISNTVGDIIEQSAEGRNNMLSGGLSSGWKQLLREGVADEEGYVEAIKKTAKEQGIAIDDMIDKEGSFEATLKSGWLTADILTDSLSNLSDETKGLSDEQLEQLGYTRDQIDSLEELNKSVQNGTISMDEFAEKMKRPSGRENLIEAVSNSFRGLMQVFTPINEAFREIFPKYTGDQLYELTVRIKELTERFTLSDTTVKNIGRTFKGLFAIFGIVKQGITALFNGIKPLFSGVGELSGGILDNTAKMGDWLVGLHDAIETSDIFNKAIKEVVDFIVNAGTIIHDTAVLVKDGVHDFIKSVSEKFDFPGMEIFHNFLERFHERMSQVGDVAGGMQSGFVTAIKIMGTALKNSNLVKAFGALWEGLKIIGNGIISILGELGGVFVEALGNADFGGLLDIINAFIAGGIGLGIKKFIDNLSEVAVNFSSFSEGLVDIFDGVRGALEAYQTKLKAEALLKIAGAIALLAAAILVISLIDSDKLSASLGAVTVLFANLMGSMMAFNKMSGGDLKGGAKLQLIATAMVAVATSILILAVALKKISGLDLDEMAVGLGGIIVLTATMVKATKSLGGVESIKGSVQMVIFAAAITILAEACTKLAQLNIGELVKGLVGVGILLAEVVLFMKFAKMDGKAISTATGIVILSGAILILSKAVSIFGAMDWTEIGKGLTSIGILLGELAIFSRLTGNVKNLISTGVGLIAISGALIILSYALKSFSDMQWDEIGRGLVGMAGALAILVLAIKMMPKTNIAMFKDSFLGSSPSGMISTGVGLIAISTAMVILAEALKRFGSMSLEEIGRGLLAVGGSIAILAGGLYLMKGSTAGSAALLIAVAALAVLVPVLSILGAMSWTSIIKGLTALAGVFVILGVAGLVLTPLVPVILSLSGALALIGVEIGRASCRERV